MSDPARGASSVAGDTILLTGATGTVGRELLARMLAAPDARLICLVRAADDAEAGRRLVDALADRPGDPLDERQRQRVRAIAGDLTRERLGLPERDWHRLADEVTRIVHGAASVTWNLPIDESRAVNVAGTERMLQLAEEGRRRGVLAKFDYLGTCMVAGKRTGLIGEDDLDDRHGFHNTYEQTKFEAESLVRGRASDVAASIFRLAMVVGDSRTGYTSTFNVMYWPLKMMARGRVLAAPGSRDGVLDMVPLDFVGEAIEAISADPARRGKAFHIAAGPASCTVGDVLDLAVERFGVKPPRLLGPRAFGLLRPLLYSVIWGKRRETMKKGRVYVPYLSYQARFDTAHVRAALEPRGIRPPVVREYFAQLIDYALATDWGRRPVRGVA
jgi:thioester reductase-like protein